MQINYLDLTQNLSARIARLHSYYPKCKDNFYQSLERLPRRRLPKRKDLDFQEERLPGRKKICVRKKPLRAITLLTYFRLIIRIKRN